MPTETNLKHLIEQLQPDAFASFDSLSKHLNQLPDVATLFRTNF